jgi:2-succinyl-6-hydroxy-2,4-cyclohexadiene-1-carboxylate synthase
VSPLAFEQSGPPAAPTVLLLHGFMGSRCDWAAVGTVLARTHRCVAIDLPGHGETGDPADESLWTPAGCVAALAGLLRAAGRGSVVGYSLGGRLALQLAVEYPELVARAVLISASPGLADEPARQARRDEDEHRARSLETRGLGPFLDDWYRQPLFAQLREHPRFPEVLERRRRNDPRLLARSLRALGTGSQRSLWRDLPGLRAPLLFLAGERDAKFTALAFAAVAACPQGEAVVLRGRGHALVEEDPEAVARETEAFLGTRRAG